VVLKPLTSHTYPIDSATNAYTMMMAGTEPYLGIMITYPENAVVRTAPRVEVDQSQRQDRMALGIIGAGNHVRDMLLPHLTGQPDIDLRWVCTATGVSANSLANRLGIASRTTDYRDVLNDPVTDAVLIGSRHGSHARFVREALEAGKHVFVEKPLCRTEDELGGISAAYAARATEGIRLMVGFNRRFSEHGRRAREFFAGHRDPLVMVYRVNAGSIPAGHWIQDLDDGGGRIVGEACHFLDYMQFVCGARPVLARGLAVGMHTSGITEDHSVLSFRFGDSSVGTIIYAAGGDRNLAKERFEAFGDGKSLVMDDFLVSEFYERGRRTQFKSAKRDKGFAAEMRQFREEVLHGGPPAMPYADIEAVSLACIMAARSLRTGDEFRL
jgi:predicted dehydrogenase